MKILGLLPLSVLFIIISYLSILEGTNRTRTPTLRESKKFILITSLYNETNDSRIREYITCFEKNLAHENIEKIFVFYDNSKDNLGKQIILNYLKNINVPIIYTSKRPTFKDIFEVANKYCPNSHVIICNADIFFNSTLKLLRDYDLTSTFIVLSRRDIKMNGSLQLVRNPYSQDAWIFQTPIRHIHSEDIPLGTWWCDSKISLRAHQSGLKVINPCLSIDCLHLHLSGIYSDDRGCTAYIAIHGKPPTEKEIMPVPAITLQ